MTQPVHRVPTEEILELSSLHSLGLLDAEAAENFERHLESGCDVCAAELQRFREIAAQLACLPEQVAPDASVRSRLMERSASARPGVARTSEMEWRPSGLPGILVKVLYSDSRTGATTSLVRMEAGAKYPPHRHAGLEHLYILEGDLVFHDHTLHAGDYEVSESSTDHPPATTKNGCLVLVLHNRHDEMLARV